MSLQDKTHGDDKNRRILLPDYLFGKSTRESYDKVLAEKDNPSNETPKSEKPKRRRTQAKTTSVQRIDLSEYILLPKHNIYVAKEITLEGKDWTQAHKEAQKQEARMLTLREFTDFLLLLKTGKAEDGLGNKISKSELDILYLDITEVRAPYRAEWLDAFFDNIKGIKHINYNHKFLNGKFEATKSSPLETCIMKNCKVELNSFNKQGLPTKEGTDFSYWCPIDGRVAWFDADAGGAGLGCDGIASGSYAYLGVRLVREK